MGKNNRAFAKAAAIIQAAKNSVYRKVNEELIGMYWYVEKIVSEEKGYASYGGVSVSPVVTQLPKKGTSFRLFFNM